MAGVVAYSGHRFLGDASSERRIAADMAELTGRHEVAAGYGSLAAGADVLWAESLLARGAELHVVLPFDPARFVAASVQPAGDAWVARFGSLLAGATSVDVLADDSSRADDRSYATAAGRFQAEAVARARALGVTPRLLVVWDGAAATGEAGTAADIEQWRRLGHPVDVIPVARPSSS